MVNLGPGAGCTGGGFAFDAGAYILDLGRDLRRVGIFVVESAEGFAGFFFPSLDHKPCGDSGNMMMPTPRRRAKGIWQIIGVLHCQLLDEWRFAEPAHTADAYRLPIARPTLESPRSKPRLCVPPSLVNICKSGTSRKKHLLWRC